jgi:hypothetical protein
MAVTVKITVFWDVMPCTLVDEHQHLRELDAFTFKVDESNYYPVKSTNYRQTYSFSFAPYIMIYLDMRTFSIAFTNLHHGNQHLGN